MKGSLLSCSSTQGNVYCRVTNHIISRHYAVNRLKNEALYNTQLQDTSTF